MSDESNPFIQVRFIPNCGPGCGHGWFQSGSGDLGRRSAPPSDTLLQEQELLRIIVERLAYRQNPNINGNPTLSSVFGQPNFLPFPFLSLGVRRGAAVCRILRKFPTIESAEHLIKSLNQVQSKEGWRKGKPFSSTELAEICCINPNSVKDFFEIPDGFEDEKIIPLEARFFSNKLKQIPYGTGFLVSRDKLLTNHHILPIKDDGAVNEDLIRDYIAEFNYEQDDLGREISSVKYQFKKLLVSDPDLDFALIILEQKPVQEGDDKYDTVGVAGDRFGWITLLDDDSVIAPPLARIRAENLRALVGQAIASISKEGTLIKLGVSDLPSDLQVDKLLNLLQEKAVNGDPVNIIQHPKGRFKEIVLSNNRVQELREKFILYEADTDFSSSGSPVFNQQWQLVGLHSGAVDLVDENEKSNSTNEGRLQVGVRVSRIVEFLVGKLEEFVDTYEKQESRTDDSKTKVFELCLFFIDFVNLTKREGVRIPIELEEFVKFLQREKSFAFGNLKDFATGLATSSLDEVGGSLNS